MKKVWAPRPKKDASDQLEKKRNNAAPKKSPRSPEKNVKGPGNKKSFAIKNPLVRETKQLRWGRDCKVGLFGD